MKEQKNVFGEELLLCSESPMTGYYRDGTCSTDQTDRGSHTVCVSVDKEFLAYTAQQGNDLSTPMPEFGFPGLKPGDRWCVCASRWHEAYQAGKAPKVILMSTHERALDIIPIEILKKYAIDLV
jgi:uncharacterized protein (DUF2237 family)